MQKNTYIAKTLFGLEGVLAKELADMGAEDIVPLNRAVRFRGDKILLYKANYCLRTALRIIMPIKRFEATTSDDLYAGVKAINWQEFMNTGSTFSISSFANQAPELTNSQFISLRAKDAIADQFLERFSKRPSVERKAPELYIDIHIYKTECTISLDSSGDSLNRRGYRAETDRAPMNEVLAAGIAMLSGWDGKSDFVDFMCGSGTLAIEAMLMARNIAPGKFRKGFGFMNWPDFDVMVWRHVREDATRAERPYKYEALASDVSEEAIGIALRNIQRAGLEEDINVVRQDFRRVRPEKGPGMLMINPPYGERIGEAEEIEELYWTIGDHLKEYYPDYHAWIISSQRKALKRIDMLKPTDRHKLMNGPLECELAHYYIYPPKTETGESQIGLEV